MGSLGNVNFNFECGDELKIAFAFLSIPVNGSLQILLNYENNQGISLPTPAI